MASDLRVIYLGPPEASGVEHTRLWCEDDVWDEGEGVPYVRVDALDPTDEAQVEAVAIGMVGAAWYCNDPEGSRNSARRAIIAARRHITGDTP